MSEAEPAAEQFSPGRTLAAARAERNLSVADISQQIKYGVKQIAAIEADDYAKLPGTTFVRGMIRGYAKLVQLDPQPLLAELGRRDLPPAVTVDLRKGEREQAGLEAFLAANKGKVLTRDQVAEVFNQNRIRIGEKVLVAVAARVGKTRLIDNVLLRDLR